MIEEHGEGIQDDTIMTKDERYTNQAPTAAKFGTAADFASTGVSADSAGGFSVDFDGGAGVSADLEESWLTLAFFFFLSKAVRCRFSEIARR